MESNILSSIWRVTIFLWITREDESSIWRVKIILWIIREDEEGAEELKLDEEPPKRDEEVNQQKLQQQGQAL